MSISYLFNNCLFISLSFDFSIVSKFEGAVKIFEYFWIGKIDGKLHRYKNLTKSKETKIRLVSAFLSKNFREFGQIF